MISLASGKRANKARLGRKLGRTVTPTNVERTFARDELIVSKTDLTGHITYANDVFLRLADLDLSQTIGAPHSIIRHPDMPRCVFKLLWDHLGQEKEIFAYVKNMSANGDHYWVYAHVTPSYDLQGKVAGYHSNRRVPEKGIVQSVIEPLYATLRGIEQKHSDRKEGLRKSYEEMTRVWQEKGLEYDEFICTL